MAIKREHAKNKVRERVANEILTTEVNYVKSLETIVRQLYIPVTSTSIPVLTKTESANLFMNINDLLMHHMRFQKLLEKSLQDWSFSTTLGNVFLQNMDFLAAYQEYLTGYDTALITLRRLESSNNDNWMTLLRAFERHQLKSTRLNLEAYLIMPVQRLPRYTLLLKELLKYTNEGHQDHDLLQKAIEKNRSILDDIHSHIDAEAGEHTLKLLNATDSVENLPPDLQPLARAKRRLLREGLAFVQMGQSSKPMPSYVFVMNDLVLITEKKKKPEGQLQFSFVTSFDMFRVQSVLEIPLEHKKVNPKTAFGVLIKQLGAEHSYVSFGFRNPQQRSEWLEVMKEQKSLQHG